MLDASNHSSAQSLSDPIFGDDDDLFLDPPTAPAPQAAPQIIEREDQSPQKEDVSLQAKESSVLIDLRQEIEDQLSLIKKMRRDIKVKFGASESSVDSKNLSKAIQSLSGATVGLSRCIIELHKMEDKLGMMRTQKSDDEATPARAEAVVLPLEARLKEYAAEKNG